VEQRDQEYAQGLGLKRGDRVMIYMPNAPQFVIAFYGILRAGAIVVPTNPQYVPQELAYQASDTGAETVIALTMSWSTIREARHRTPLKRIVLSNIKDFPPVLKLLFTLTKEKKGGHRPDVSGEPGVYDFQTLLERAGAVQPVDVRQDAAEDGGGEGAAPHAARRGTGEARRRFSAPRLI